MFFDYIKINLFLLFVGLSYLIEAQNLIPDKFHFQYPLSEPLFVSGTFGELRRNHFHSGIDFSGKGKEGQKVFAVADGYVSRILVSSRGYGKTLYVTHANGLVSVYGHLKGFNKTIDNYVKNEQYAKQSFYVNIYPEKLKLPVKKGEVIGYLGNTGNSTGPHLHFEFREEITEQVINPQLFNFNIIDDKPPIIEAIRIIPLDENTLINGKNEAITIKIHNKKNNNIIIINDVPIVSGKVALGIKVYDFNNTINSRTGVYKLSVWLDTILFYQHVMNKFSFDETRYINDLIDYPEYRKGNGRYIITRVSPGNKLNIYTQLYNKGVFIFDKNQKYKIKFKVEDFNQNSSYLELYIKGSPLNNKNFQNNINACKNTFYFNDTSYFKNDFVELTVLPGTLYDDICFTYSKKNKPSWAFSSIHSIHNPDVPLHYNYKLSIKPENLPSNLQKKALIAYVIGKNKLKSLGGIYDNGMITTNVSEFGDFVIVVDTVSPIIEPINIHNDKDVSSQTTIDFKIKDDLSGIKSYNAYINDVWVLMEYDEKNNLLVYNFDDNILPGINTFLLEVIDNCNNISVFEANILY